MNTISNHDLTVGKLRATTCEWFEKDDSRCDHKVVFGKPYCTEHMKKAYRTVSTAEFEKETDTVIKEVVALEASGEAMPDEVAENDDI